MEPSPPAPENPYEAPRFDAQAAPPPGNDGSQLEATDWVLAVLCSGIGCIMGIVWLVQGKSKGLKMIGISLMFSFLWNVLYAILMNASK